MLKMGRKGIFVVSLGGSVVVPSSIDVQFLKGFRQLILKHVKQGCRFIIVCGGGRVCRDYQKAALEVRKLSDEELDWIGVHATRLNAQLLHGVLGDVAHNVVVHGPSAAESFSEPVMIAAGWRPGWSTDYVAVSLARNYKASKVINITGKGFVYDRNPDEHEDARPLKSMKWPEFRRMFGAGWSPGLNVPFDPVASREAMKSRIKVIVVGSDLMNLEKCLSGKQFEGTVIG